MVCRPSLRQRGHNALVKAHEECSAWGHGLQAELEALQRDHKLHWRSVRRGSMVYVRA